MIIIDSILLGPIYLLQKIHCFGGGTPQFGTTMYGRSWDSVVGIATSYWLDGRGVGVRVPVGSRIFSSPSRPDRFWGPPNFLANEYTGGCSLGVKVAEA
jgi:hypothetical protein